MNRVKELRQTADLKQSDLAKMLNVVQSTISGWEHNQFDPSGDSLAQLAKTFDTSIDYLLCHSDIKRASSLEDADLSEGEKQFLEHFRNAPPALQEAALRVLETDLRKG